MTFKELGNIHPQILEKCKERAIDQKCEIDLKSRITAGRTGGGFDWDKTIEYKRDVNFWYNILNMQNFDKFYKTYPLKPQIEINYISSDKIYKASFNGKNYEITIKEI